MEINNTATQNVYSRSMSEYARGQHPNSEKSRFPRGHKNNQKGKHPLSKRVMIRLTDEQFQKLQAIAVQKGVTKADLFRSLLDKLPENSTQN